MHGQMVRAGGGIGEDASVPKLAFCTGKVTMRQRGNAKPSKIQAGAGDGTRTRDALLGRQVLYQLSYSRM